MILHLPLAPSTNHYWRHAIVGRRVRVYVSEAGQAYRRTVASIVAKARRDGLVPRDALRCRLAVAVALHMPNRQARDIDNFGSKALLDALTHAGLWADDTLIDRLSLERGEIIPGGACVVLVETMAAVRKAA